MKISVGIHNREDLWYAWRFYIFISIEMVTLKFLLRVVVKKPRGFPGMQKRPFIRYDFSPVRKTATN